MGTVTAVEAATETSRATARTVWLTGLPSAGKTTIALGLAARLRDAGRRVEVLDGDAAREVLTAGLGFSRRDRDENVRRIGYVADLLSRNGVDAVCSVISPFRGARDEVRARHDGRFVEVWVATPLDVCARRDVKGLYARHARRGDWPDRCRRSVRGSGRSRGRARHARDDRRRVRRAGVGGGVRMTRLAFSAEELADLDRRFEHATAGEIVAWAVESFGDGLCLAASMADAVLIDVATRVDPAIEVVFLDTQYHFAETLETAERVRRRYRLRLTVLNPDREPDDLWRTDTDGCCAVRKVEPLDRHLAGRRAWMSGLRRTDSTERAHRRSSTVTGAGWSRSIRSPRGPTTMSPPTWPRTTCR